MKNRISHLPRYEKRHAETDSVQNAVMVFSAGLAGFILWTVYFVISDENAILLGAYGIACFVFALIELLLARSKERKYKIERAIEKLIGNEDRNTLMPHSYNRLMGNYYVKPK